MRLVESQIDFDAGGLLDDARTSIATSAEVCNIRPLELPERDLTLTERLLEEIDVIYVSPGHCSS